MEVEKIKRQYVCEACHQTCDYDDNWTDENADKEAEELHGIKNSSKDPTCAIVCDDCFKNMRARGLF